MHSSYFSVLFGFILFLTNISKGDDIILPEEIVWTQINDHLILKLENNENKISKIQSCGFDIFKSYEKTDKILVLTSQSNISNSIVKMEINSCKLIINPIRETNFTFYSVTASNFDENIFLKKNFIVKRWVEPDLPQIHDKSTLEEIQNENKVVNVSCCSNRGVPSPQLSFFLDEERVDEKLVNNFQNETTGEICIAWRDIKFDWTFNGKTLNCSINQHPSLKNEKTKKKIYLRDSVYLQVEHPPKLMGKYNESLTEIKLKVPKKSDSFDLTFTISANPKINKVDWFYKNNANDKEKGFNSFGEDKTKFIFLSVNISNFTSNETLRINNFDKKDLNREYILRITNSVGEHQIFIALELSNSFTKLKEVIIAVGSVVAVLALLISIYLSKTKGYFCFSRKSQVYDMKGMINEREMKPLKVNADASYAGINKKSEIEIDAREIPG